MKCLSDKEWALALSFALSTKWNLFEVSYFSTTPLEMLPCSAIIKVCKRKLVQAC